MKESVGETELKCTEFLSKHYVSLVRYDKWLFHHIQNSTREPENLAVVPDHQKYFQYRKKEIIKFCNERMINCPLLTSDCEDKYRNWLCNLMEDPNDTFSDYDDEDILWYIFQNNDEELDEYLEMDVTERRQMFFRYVCKHQKVPPKRLFKFNADVSVASMQILNDLVLCIISRAMTGGDDIDRHVKIFLTRLNNAMSGWTNTSENTRKKLPFIIARMNLISMLNLQNTVDYYGAFRYLWEVGGYGEGAIPKIKKFINSTKSGYAKRTVTKYLKEVMMKNSFLQLEKNIAKNVADNSGFTDTIQNMVSSQYEGYGLSLIHI